MVDERPSDDELQQDAEAIFDEYDVKFAGKPRATRDLDELDALIERLEDLMERARRRLNGGEDDAMANLIERANENLGIYREERAAIAEVQAGGEATRRAGQWATWANVEFHRYRRHFAGQNRATRDVERLNEIIEELKFVRERMEALRGEEELEGLEDDIRTVEENRKRYRDERERIVEARHDGSLDEQASFLAELANSQFDIYSNLFAGRDRVSRRPSLLRRVIRTLENVYNRMETLEEKGLSGDQNRQNREIVSDNLEMYRDELEAIESARRQIDDEDRAGRLGAAANEVFEAYQESFAGQNRATRELEELSWMCDELYHVAREMRDLEESGGPEANTENLEIVIENLTLYQREYDEIDELTDTSTSSPV
jgi:hypothetical protein